MKTSAMIRRMVWALTAITASLCVVTPSTRGQGSRKDDIVFGPSGHPVANATIRVCQPTAMGTPCTPLATIYTDATLTVAASNPFQTDGIGNYHFYAPAGRYQLQVSGQGITGTITYPDVILPADLSSQGSGNNISAFGLTLGGNLSVAGNASVSGTLSTGSFSPSTFSPATLSISGNETVGGPRPRVDVTAYGAKGDGGTDDTAAIQAAINFACQNASGGGANGGGAVTFPPPVGVSYKVTQPQSPNNSPIFTIPSGCQGAGNGLSIAGGSGNWGQVTNGGGRPPMISILVSCGTSPGLGPVFLFDHSENIFMQDISITGCNQAVQVNGTVTNGPTWHFQNVNMGIQVVSGQGICSSNPTCTTDNVPFVLYNDIEGWYEGGAFQNGGSFAGAAATGPNILVVEENGGSGNGSGLATFSNLFLAGPGTGGGVLADTRCNNGCSAAQNLRFTDTETEGAGSTPFLIVQAENGSLNSAGNYYLEHVGGADNNPGTPCVYLSGASWYPDIVLVDNICSGTASPAIVVQSGTILGCLIVGNQTSGHGAVNASGQAVSGCTWQTNSGLDYASAINSLSSNNLATNAIAPNGYFGNTSTCPIGMTKAGDTNRSVCIDPFFGLGLGPGGANGSGYDTRLYRSGNQSLALMLAQANGPTNPTATIASGGSLTTGTYTIGNITNIGGSTEEVFCPAACFVSLGQSIPISGNSNSSFNTTVTVSATKGPQVWDFTTSMPGNGTGGTFPTSYWYAVESTMVASSCAASTLTGPSKEVNAAPVSGSQTINLSWTAGAGSAAGYCVWRGPAPGAENAYVYVSGMGATSFTDTGNVTFTSGSPSTVNQTFPANPQFTWNPTGLGINTTTPQFNLDVNGTAAVNALNGVQKAERFTGADAAAKVNACLAAAATSSGVCDARGLTGSLSGSAHITIPTATILLWGNAQLTVSDATTNDAIELGGDGASLYGEQGTGPGLVSRPDSGGYIACGTTGCTVVKNPNAATGNIEWNNIEKMSLIATGTSSKVIDLTSIGHAHLEDNRIILGTGGESYGIFGDTSNGNHDSTNNLIKHNEIDNQSQNDICLYEAGIFNINQLEINVCYLSSQNTGQSGYVFAKDSNGNYPNNVQLYGNDCEQGGSSQSFGVICYDVRNAQDITIGPNNRCEHVYNCFRFPSDGSAVGIHVIDPYLSLSNNTQIEPNEPATAMVAVDNNGHNWTPSFHFGISDTAGPNLLGNAGFEGWQNATTLYYWGGVSGTNINQSGSGIYLQGTSAGANPAADPFTQGAYNLRVGDGATAGLGVNSGCIQVDATAEYTLMFRVAAPSTSNNFRPGLRFYSDANCTEANKITNIATNARVLTPQNYMGYSALAGTGPNWQSTNASLTYNNGINCNCNVTGLDWNVATASSWTPTRNYGITFRVPNAYSSASATAHSMRVFLLENTAATNNYVYFDDIILSQGPVSPDVRTAALADSGSPTVYGNLSVSGSFSDPNFAAHGVLLGEGSNAVTATAPTGNSQCLMSASTNGTSTDPSFQTCPGAGSSSVTSVSGDGTLISNSGSAGAVTLTVGAAGAHKWWGNSTGSTGSPGYSSLGVADLPTSIPNSNLQYSSVTVNSPSFMSGWGSVSLGGSLSPSWSSQAANTFLAAPNGSSGSPNFRTILAADLPSVVVLNSQANAYTAGLQDLSAATLKVPISAGYVPTTSGLVGYDNTNNKYVFGQNGSTVSFGLSSSACAANQWVSSPATAIAAASCTQPAFSNLGGSATVGQLPGSGVTTVNSQSCTLGSSCNLGKLNDTNGNTSVQTTTTASAVDYFNVTNAAAGSPATVAAGAAGSDTNINLNLTSKGTGKVQANGNPVVTGPASSTSADIASFNSTAGNVIQDSGVPAPTLASRYAQGSNSAGAAASAANAINVAVVTLPAITFSHIVLYVNTVDASNSYSWALTDMSGNAKCHMSSAVSIGSTGANAQSCAEGTVTLPEGNYVFAFTGNSTTGKIGEDSTTAALSLSSATSGSTSSSGVMSFPISIPTAGATASSYGRPFLVLY